jgi:hypothetical protein
MRSALRLSVFVPTSLRSVSGVIPHYTLSDLAQVALRNHFRYWELKGKPAVRPPYGFSILIRRLWRAFSRLKNEPTAEAFLQRLYRITREASVARSRRRAPLRSSPVRSLDATICRSARHIILMAAYICARPLSGRFSELAIFDARFISEYAASMSLRSAGPWIAALHQGTRLRDHIFHTSRPDSTPPAEAKRRRIVTLTKDQLKSTARVTIGTAVWLLAFTLVSRPI